MKKNLVLIGIIALTIILAVLSVVTAMKIKQLGTEPIAPSAPKSVPKAVGPTATPTIPEITPAVVACRPTFIVLPTVTPGGPTSTPTSVPTTTSVPSSPTNTPTPVSSQDAYCDYLTVDKTSGNASLVVAFKGKGVDAKRVKGFRFTFGDGEKQEIFGSYTSSHIQEVSHTYAKTGAFTAILEIQDDGDHWRTRDECRIIITAGQGTVNPTATPKPTSTPRPGVTNVPSEPTPTEIQLPKAGLKMPTIGGIIAGFLLIAIGAALVF